MGSLGVRRDRRLALDASCIMTMRGNEFVAYVRGKPDYHIRISKTEAEFIQAVELALVNAMGLLETLSPMSDVGVLQLREELLSGFLCQLMVAMDVEAANDGYHGGHVDLTIRHPRRKYLVALGECKIWDGYVWHVKGCRQLLDRYLTGRQRRGFCIEFFTIANMMGILKGLSEEYASKRPLELSGEPRPHEWIDGAFITRHPHSSGAMIEICHVGCNMFHLHPRIKKRRVKKEEDAP